MVFGPEGQIGAAIRFVGALALGYWAVDELLRGVNPWRRCLGGAVLAGLAWTVLRALT